MDSSAAGTPEAVSENRHLEVTRRRNTRRRAGLCVCAALVLLSFAAFEGAAAQQAEEMRRSVRGDPIRIGASLSFTGTYSEPSKMMYEAYTLWAEQIEKRGGLLGRPVELIIKDDQSSPERAADIYRELIEEDEVDLVLSPYGTPVTLAVSEVTEEHGYVLLAAASAGEETWSRGYSRVFGMYSPAEHYFTGFLDLCAREGINSVSILYERNPFNRDAANGAHLWAGRMGLDRIRLYGFDPDTDKLGRVWEHLERRDNEALIVCSYPPAGNRVLELLGQSDYNPEAIGMTITPVEPDFYEQAAEIESDGASLAEGIFAPTQWEPNERVPFPGTVRFIDAFEDHTSQEPTYHAASAYSSCRLLEEAASTTRGVDHDALGQYIRGLDTVTVLGRFKVDSRGKQIGHNPMLIQWQEGRKEIVYPISVQTAEPRF
ncbi:MAG: amino acid ABC transporter substrate-binding protein [Spirochaetia bacterium]